MNLSTKHPGGGLDRVVRAAGYIFGDALEERLARLRRAGMTRREIGRSPEGRPIFVYDFVAAGGTPPLESAARTDRGLAGPGSGLPEAPGTASARSSLDHAGGTVLLLSLLHPMEWIGLEANLALLETWLVPDPKPRRKEPGRPSSSTAEPGTESPSGAPQSRPRKIPARISSIPIINPDGFARVEESLRIGRIRWVRGNARGVDLNRNFPAGFRRRSRVLDFWPLYRPGGTPLSEPETAATAAWVHEALPAVTLSLHSFGRWIFYPPAARYRPDARTIVHRDAAREALAEHRGSYRAGQLGHWSPFFRAHGTEIDFAAEATGGLAYLVELSQNGFGGWGARRLLHPFFTFNPPDPRRELEMILPALRRLAETAAG